MVATQNIETFVPNLTFSLRVYSFCASGLDINGCVMSYFEGTAIYSVIEALLYYSLYLRHIVASVISSVLSRENI